MAILAPSRRRLASAASPLLVVSLLVSAAAVVLPAAPARAEDKTAARDHWEKGTKFYDLGKYDDAIREFEAAYEAKGDPAFLYNLAQSHRLAGHPADSLRFYRTYLRYVPKAPNRADIEERIKELEKIVAERPATEPAVTPPPSTGTTGNPAFPPPSGGPTSAPPPIGSPPGTGPGSGMPGGAAPPPGGPGSAPMPGGAPPQGGPLPPPGSQPPFAGGSPTEPLPTAQSSGRRTAGITVAAIGGGVFVVGGIFGLVARSQSKKVEEADRFDPSVESLGKTSETLQWIGYGVGAAAVITGVIVYLTAPPPTETAPPPQVAVAPLVGPGSGGALLRVHF